MSFTSRIIATFNAKIENNDPIACKIIEILRKNSKEKSLIKILNAFNIRFNNITLRFNYDLDEQAEKILKQASEKNIDDPWLETLLKDKEFKGIFEEIINENINPAALIKIITVSRNDTCFQVLEIIRILEKNLSIDASFTNTFEISEFLFKLIEGNKIEEYDTIDEDLLPIFSYVIDKELFHKLMQNDNVKNFLLELIENHINPQEILENIYKLNLVKQNQLEIFNTPMNILTKKKPRFDPNITEIADTSLPSNSRIPLLTHFETALTEESPQIQINTPHSLHIETPNNKTKLYTTINTPYREIIGKTEEKTKFYTPTNQIPFRPDIEKSDDKTKFYTPINQTPYTQFPRVNNFANSTRFPTYTNSLEPSVLAQVKPYSLPEIIKVIPEFNGNPNDLQNFIAGCNSAINLVPFDIDSELVKIIHIKLSGTARDIIEDRHFRSLRELLGYFQRIFGETQSFYQLAGQLANIKQAQNESIIAFALRLKKKSKNLAKAAIREGKYNTNFEQNLEADLKKFFFEGIKLEYRVQIANSMYKNLDEIIDDAIIIEKNITKTTPTKIYGITTESIKCQFCDRLGHSSKNCNKIQKTSKEKIKCQHCGKLGHSSKTCYSITKPYGDKKSQDTKTPEKCQYCDKVGHTSKSCQEIKTQKTPSTEQTQNSRTKTCNYCKKSGHVIQDCRRRKYNNERREKTQTENQGNETQSLQTGALQETPKQQ